MITRTRRRPSATATAEIITAAAVALVEFIFRLFRCVHAPYYALFLVAPVANMMEIQMDRRKKLSSKP